MKLSKSMIENLLDAPESQMDPKLKDDIRKWNAEPTALEILYILDKMICYSWASGFVVRMFQSFFRMACSKEGKTEEEVLAQRSWDLLEE